MVEQLGTALINCGLLPYAGIGHHFAGLAAFRHGAGDCNLALWHLERAMALCEHSFKARTLLAIGSVSEIIEGNNTGFLKACLLAKSLNDRVAAVEASRAIAIIDSIDGNHTRALERLLSLYPMVIGQGGLYQLPYDYLNSLAVELLATGNLELAEKASNLAMSSEYAAAYPEWQATRADIASATPAGNVVAMPGVSKSQAWAKLLGVLRAGYPRYSVRTIQRLTQMAQVA